MRRRLLLLSVAIVMTLATAHRLCAQNPSPQGVLNCRGCIVVSQEPLVHGCMSGVANGWQYCIPLEDGCELFGNHNCPNFTVADEYLLASNDERAQILLERGGTELFPGVILFRGCTSDESAVVLEEPAGGGVVIRRRYGETSFER